MKSKFARLAIIAALFGPLSAHAVDGVSFEVGNGDATDMGRIGMSWNWDKKWFADGDWYLGGYWDLQLGYWDGKQNGAFQAYDLVDVGLTPVFRFQQHKPSALAPYFEAAIGFHLISRTKINDDRRFATAFQFGDHVGVGFTFGDRHQYDLSYRFQHLSNGSIKQPNQGINFNQIRFGYHF